MASGQYDTTTKTWTWDSVLWQKTEKGIYQSNRIIPDLFFKQKWPIDKKRKAGVILIRRNKIKGIPPDIWLVECYLSGSFGFPKGTCEKFETFRQAAEREFYEETGTEIKIPDKCPCITIDRERSTAVFFIVYVSPEFDITTFPISDVEITKFGWVNLQQIYDQTFRLSRTTKNVILNKTI
jgi:8-oxo-dGTP pyrophosphatase MutT (NUDIX family)